VLGALVGAPDVAPMVFGMNKYAGCEKAAGFGQNPPPFWKNVAGFG